MPEKNISPEQLRKLQVLYGQHERRSLDAAAGDRRAARLLWASTFTGRAIASFNDLTRAEAKQAIDHLHSALGIVPVRTKKMSREAGRRAGLDGRGDGQEFAAAPQLASAADLESIEQLYARLGWTRAQFDAWLRSPRSPLGRSSNPKLITTAQANRVRWGLQSLLKKRGLWEQRG